MFILNSNSHYYYYYHHYYCCVLNSIIISNERTNEQKNLTNLFEIISITDMDAAVEQLSYAVESGEAAQRIVATRMLALNDPLSNAQVTSTK
jgi:hypothetical protein